ncbi:hypothetical protein S40285_02275 [Stachybotrys chlorohalonatus IBT 40285]|uniref:Uncharacterized protein n=1 Tax=Stachybotrys chlorohalonatus (strain IBT 40285) TaxID=1283841 RepID=A0A084QFW6_STAC4|nr:hypothetical protein S40285_02275 [Stachybotrys chlorohalonata IBT 40285]
MAFLEDPRLRQRWNQFTQNTETVTENAAAGIWSFQHNYINPCFGSIVGSVEQCTTVCLGDPEDRLRRRRERERERAEYSFDFYDDWYQEEQNGGLLGSWGGEDWDRLLAGSGSSRKHGGETDQPKRKRGMSYGTRGGRRKTTEGEDPTIIPSTQPIGFLSRLPWKMGGTLRYKPSAANLQEHPGRHEIGESEPLLAIDDTEPDLTESRVYRKRSGTTGSAQTSDSYRSRGDLFPSDGEGEEDAIPLDDEITYDMVRKDDRSSGKSRGKGKRPASGFATSRSVSRTTLGSTTSRDSLRMERTSTSQPVTPLIREPPSLDDLRVEEVQLQLQEDLEVARKREAAVQLAAERGLGVDTSVEASSAVLKSVEDEASDTPYPTETPYSTRTDDEDDNDDGPKQVHGEEQSLKRPADAQPPAGSFVPARLPNFG